MFCFFVKVNLTNSKLINRLIFRCPHCTDYYWNICDLNKHRLMHTDVQYNCETCGSTFTSKDNFYMHCASHFKEKKVYTYPDVQFICDICQKIFKSKGSIRNHMVLHTGEFTVRQSNLFFISHS